MIKGTLPEVLILNINWFNNMVPFMDTLQFCSGIPQRFDISHLYSMEENVGQKAYILKSVVCFLGAHYMTYTKKRMPNGELVWKLYDDANPIKYFKSLFL